MQTIVKTFLYPVNGFFKAKLIININRHNKRFPFSVELQETGPSMFHKTGNFILTDSMGEVRCFISECIDHIGDYIIDPQNASINLNYPPRPRVPFTGKELLDQLFSDMRLPA